jgi:hypothetical protein
LEPGATAMGEAAASFLVAREYVVRDLAGKVLHIDGGERARR